MEKLTLHFSDLVWEDTSPPPFFDTKNVSYLYYLFFKGNLHLFYSSERGLLSPVEKMKNFINSCTSMNGFSRSILTHYDLDMPTKQPGVQGDGRLTAAVGHDTLRVRVLRDADAQLLVEIRTPESENACSSPISAKGDEGFQHPLLAGVA
jgi:hypothetical protein